jgi:hypothetical protein
MDGVIKSFSMLQGGRGELRGERGVESGCSSADEAQAVGTAGQGGADTGRNPSWAGVQHTHAHLNCSDSRCTPLIASKPLSFFALLVADSSCDNRGGGAVAQGGLEGASERKDGGHTHTA